MAYLFLQIYTTVYCQFSILKLNFTILTLNSSQLPCLVFTIFSCYGNLVALVRFFLVYMHMLEQ